MFATLTFTRQKTPAAWVEMGSAPEVFLELSTPVTLNSNLPSWAAWFRPTALAESPDDEPPPEEEVADESLSPPPLVAMTMIRAMAARRMRRFFLKKGRLALR